MILFCILAVPEHCCRCRAAVVRDPYGSSLYPSASVGSRHSSATGAICWRTVPTSPTAMSQSISILGLAVAAILTAQQALPRMIIKNLFESLSTARRGSSRVTVPNEQSFMKHLPVQQPFQSKLDAGSIVPLKFSKPSRRAEPAERSPYPPGTRPSGLDCAAAR